MKGAGVFLILMFIVMGVSAQGNVMEEYFYRSGKINVVIAVASVVMIGIFIYLFRLDRKITGIEKKLNSEQKKS